MATEWTSADDGVFKEFAARLRERRQRARREGDEGSAARYEAMLAVLNTKLVPLVCPEAVTLAGQAAKAACEGRQEGEWLQGLCRDRDRSGGDRVALFKAVRVLKTVGLWPWRPARRGGTAVEVGGGGPAFSGPAEAPHGDPEESAMGLEV
jgi:hypothetical protein